MRRDNEGRRPMRVRPMLTMVLVALGAVASGASSPPADQHTLIRPEGIAWGPPPPAVPPGPRFAVIQGDPSVAGEPYTFRVKVPAGFSFPPHWHSMDEQMTVLEGTI